MSLFNKVLASIGIGNAQVNTQLEKSTYTAGEVLRGIVVIQGGNVAQEIGQINLALKTKYVKEMNDSKFYQEGIICSFVISESFTIEAGERKEIPFDFRLPFLTPITAGQSQIWLHTGLDISLAVDPTDQDFIRVNPSPLVSSVLNAVESLGFRLRTVENEKPSHKLGTHAAFIQEFEYRATGEFRRYLDELEVTFIRHSEDELTFVLQVDRRARGLGGLLSEALDMDETFIRVTVTPNDIPNMRSIVDNTIRRYMK